MSGHGEQKPWRFRASLIVHFYRIILIAPLIEYENLNTVRCSRSQRTGESECQNKPAAPATSMTYTDAAGSDRIGGG
jgi:hypothetical protein